MLEAPPLSITDRERDGSLSLIGTYILSITDKDHPEC